MSPSVLLYMFVCMVSNVYPRQATTIEFGSNHQGGYTIRGEISRDVHISWNGEAKPVREGLHLSYEPGIEAWGHDGTITIRYPSNISKVSVSVTDNSHWTSNGMDLSVTVGGQPLVRDYQLKGSGVHTCNVPSGYATSSTSSSIILHAYGYDDFIIRRVDIYSEQSHSLTSRQQGLSERRQLYYAYKQYLDEDYWAERIDWITREFTQTYATGFVSPLNILARIYGGGAIVEARTAIEAAAAMIAVIEAGNIVSVLNQSYGAYREIYERHRTLGKFEDIYQLIESERSQDAVVLIDQLLNELRNWRSRVSSEFLFYANDNAMRFVRNLLQSAIRFLEAERKALSN